MKKKLFLGLAGLLLMLGASIGFSNSQAALVTFAEGETSSEVTFQEKTYTYTSEQGVATLTLVSETEYSLVMVAADGQTISGEGTYVRTGNIIELNANGNVMKIQVSDITMTFGEVTEPVVDEEAEKEKWYTVASEWIENKVIPLLGGISLGAIASMVVSIFTAITKFKGDLTNRKIIKDQDQKVEVLEQQVEALKKENEEMKEHQKLMLEQYTVTLNETSAKMNQVANYAKTTAEMVVAQNGKIDRVTKMKDAIEASCDLTAKTIALSDVAVKSGIAKDAQKLVASLKGVSRNDQQE